MKITKGMKLTDEQKAQRKASRARNLQAWMERHEAEFKARMDAIEASSAHTKYQHEHILTIVIDLQAVPEVKRALEFFRQKCFINPGPPADLSFVAARLLAVALAHPDQLRNWVHAVIEYRRAEGFAALPDADTKIIHGWIAGRREYQT